MLPEIRQYLATLDDLRNQVADIIKDAPEDGLNWRPPLPPDADPTNSLAVLAVHVAGAEHFWIGEGVGALPPTRVRELEFKYVAKNPREALERLAKTGEETHAVLEKLTPDLLDGSFMRDDHAVPVRWAINHVIYHSGLHIGHMQLTYQLWAQGKTTMGVRWYERLPKSTPKS
jgi:hypothetical protein